jgi:hypothetical protein
MTAQARRLFLQLIKRRAQVGVESIVANNQFIELPAGRDVLIVENSCLRDVGGADQMSHEMLHQLRGQHLGPRKKV